jgi:hypothetical protein
MRPDDQPTPALDAMIAELVAGSAELAQAARENAEMLAALLAERRAATGVSPPEDAAPVALSLELVELLTEQAGAAGMSVEEYVHEAALAYVALRHDRDLHSRVREAVRTARDTRAEGRAVRAQSGQAAARRAQVTSRAGATKDGSSDGDGHADGDGHTNGDGHADGDGGSPGD